MKTLGKRSRRLLVVVIGVLVWGPGCDRAPVPPSASNMPPWAAALAALAWPSTRHEDLLFPAALLPETQGGSTSRCNVPEGQGAAPPWLQTVTATPACSAALRAVAANVTDAGRVPDGTRAEDVLTAAAVCDDEGSLPRLVAGGADVNGINSCGVTALVAAASAGTAPAVEALLKAGANPNIASARVPGRARPCWPR